jgi:hypothetical protein
MKKIASLHFTSLAVVLTCFSISSCANSDPVCYDRSTKSSVAIVDTHLHFRPFGGAPIPHKDLFTILKKSGILYANVLGIGQTLPYDSSCTYYLDCPGTPVVPSLKNDIINAQNVTELPVQEPKLTVAMSFADLSKPETVKAGIYTLDQEFPGLFKWMGELNLVKQALFANGHKPVTLEEIRNWKLFMDTLLERNMPIGLHSDLGNNENPTKYLELITEVVNRYPNNKIIWLHMGLSKELTNIDPETHIKILSNLLDKYPNMMIDLSWRVIADNYFFKPEIRAKYVPFINKYSTRILPGTDFVADNYKTFNSYLDELIATSFIYRFVDNNAFRNIALGQNYFNLLGLPDRAPNICDSQVTIK